jgi:hypothetical protein
MASSQGLDLADFLCYFVSICFMLFLFFVVVSDDPGTPVNPNLSHGGGPLPGPRFTGSPNKKGTQ